MRRSPDLTPLRWRVAEALIAYRGAVQQESNVFLCLALVVKEPRREAKAKAG